MPKLALATVLVALTAVALMTHEASQGAATCVRGERWPVKVLADPAGRALDLNKFTNTTVSALRREPVERGPGGSRGDGVESTVFEVRARLVGVRHEANGDVRLVIKGTKTARTVIVVFPWSICSTGARQDHWLTMKRATDAFVAACGVHYPVSSFAPLRGKATIRGVGFFDSQRGQFGAPNGIELHPVVRFTNASC